MKSLALRFMVWLVLQTTPLPVQGIGLRGSYSSSQADVIVNIEGENRREMEEAGGGDDATSMVAVLDDPPPLPNMQVQEDVNVEPEAEAEAEAEGGVIPQMYHVLPETTMAEAGIVGALPEESGVVIAQSPAVDQPDSAFLSTCTQGGKAELWVGYHPSTLLPGTHQAVLWVISSDTAQHKQLLNLWKGLKQDWIPTGYGGNKACAKYFTIGATKRWMGVPLLPWLDMLLPGLNMEDDLKYKLDGAVVFGNKKQESASLKGKFDTANYYLKHNFDFYSVSVLNLSDRENWVLKYEDRPEAWNMKGNLGFNVNGYIAGILSFWGYAGFKPSGGNLPGWSKPVPDAFFKKKYSNKKAFQNVFFTAHAPLCSGGTAGGKAEVWVGNHVVLGKSPWYHSKIWVISSNLDEHKAFSNQKVQLIPLWPGRVPVDYKGDKGCAKFYSIGAGPPTLLSFNDFVADLNRGDDIEKDLSHPKFVSSSYDPLTLKAQVKTANENFNWNFKKTELEYEALSTWFVLPEKITGENWYKFNSNGYTAGLLLLLKHSGIKPTGGSMPGFVKPVPTEVFTEKLTPNQLAWVLHKTYPASRSCPQSSTNVFLESEADAEVVLPQVSLLYSQEPTPSPTTLTMTELETDYLALLTPTPTNSQTNEGPRF